MLDRSLDDPSLTLCFYRPRARSTAMSTGVITTDNNTETVTPPIAVIANDCRRCDPAGGMPQIG
jgi:hypothetical protein